MADCSKYSRKGITSDVGIVFCWGTTLITDGTAGYAPGCLFIHTDGTPPDGCLYQNQGTVASSNFDAVDITVI